MNLPLTAVVLTIATTLVTSISDDVILELTMNKNLKQIKKSFLVNYIVLLNFQY